MSLSSYSDSSLILHPRLKDQKLAVDLISSFHAVHHSGHCLIFFFFFWPSLRCRKQKDSSFFWYPVLKKFDQDLLFRSGSINTSTEKASSGSKKLALSDPDLLL